MKKLLASPYVIAFTVLLLVAALLVAVMPVVNRELFCLIKNQI